LDDIPSDIPASHDWWQLKFKQKEKIGRTLTRIYPKEKKND
jgi:hypothetical protein